MRPLLVVDQHLPPWLNQIWVRERATGPWLLDIIGTPDSNGRWVFRRDPTYVNDIDQVTWTASDGITYQNPEITLAFKAAHARAKDTADLEAALPNSNRRQNAGWLKPSAISTPDTAGSTTSSARGALSADR